MPTAGGHGWYVTFADLMALLMAFFVVVAAASSADKDKMAAMVGSIREAFGVQTAKPEQAGIMEIDGAAGPRQAEERRACRSRGRRPRGRVRSRSSSTTGR